MGRRHRPDEPDRLTPDARAAFLEHLRKNCNVSAAAREIGFARQSLYELRDRDPEFREAWEEAVEEATDALEAEARRRAVEGTKRPVFQRGELVGHEIQYSDMLMSLLLKAHRPQRFGDKQQIELSGRDGKAIEVDHGDAFRNIDKLAEVYEGLEELGAFADAGAARQAGEDGHPKVH